MRIFYVLLISLTILNISACKKVFFDEVPATTNSAIFDQVWDYTNEKYSFFDFKQVEWDSVKTVYRAKVTDRISTDSLFTVLSDMLFLLRDGHVNLVSSFDISRNWNWYLDHPSNFNADLLQRHYFKDQQQLMSPFTVFDFGDVGYMYYPSFSSNVSAGRVQQILSKFRKHKGLIIDLRDNGGGAIVNVNTIGDHFVNSTTVAAHQRIKNGTGRNDFTALEPMNLNPVKGHEAFAKPVVILTNRRCYSATNMFTTMMGALPNVTVIGDKTGGGGGVPTYTQLSNGWLLRVSCSQMFSVDYINNEDGLLPDISVDMSEEDEEDFKDTILEEALKFLRQ
jgi:hypothetical protein